jgi:hypothetical protein
MVGDSVFLKQNSQKLDLTTTVIAHDRKYKKILI